MFLFYHLHLQKVLIYIPFVLFIYQNHSGLYHNLIKLFSELSESLVTNRYLLKIKLYNLYYIFLMNTIHILNKNYISKNTTSLLINISTINHSKNISLSHNSKFFYLSLLLIVLITNQSHSNNYIKHSISISQMTSILAFHANLTNCVYLILLIYIKTYLTIIVFVILNLYILILINSNSTILIILGSLISTLNSDSESMNQEIS